MDEAFMFSNGMAAKTISGLKGSVNNKSCHVL